VREACNRHALSEHERQAVRRCMYPGIFEPQIRCDPENMLFPPQSSDRIEHLLRG